MSEHTKSSFGAFVSVDAWEAAIEALEEFNKFFTSSNDIPVERTTIKADSDAVIKMKAALLKAKGEG